MMNDKNLLALIKQMTLPEEYAEYIPQYFDPIVAKINRLSEHRKTTVVGINGSQGSGKSTAAVILQYLLESRYQHRVAILSIDDFYHTKATRQALAQSQHPLFVTRGVPGTHDVKLALDTFGHLKNADDNEVICLPRFDKAKDDRKPRKDWEVLAERPSIIIFEGWCVGAPSMSNKELEKPINELEAKEDGDGLWRHAVNNYLQTQYQILFSQIDWLLMLKAPSFDVVYDWRLLQERKLEQSLNGEHNLLLSKSQLNRFIQHYQRITELCLKTIPAFSDALIELDEQHRMINLRMRSDDN